MSCLPTIYPDPTICQQVGHDDLPELGAKVPGPNRGNKPRLLVGWRHQEDTAEATKHGRLWCWVGGPYFQVYDESYNRSENAGEVRFCGPANFTMIRMFHPWFAMFAGQVVPRDKVSGDKKWCRQRYRQAMSRYGIRNAADGDNNGYEDGYDDDDDEDVDLSSDHANQSFGRGQYAGIDSDSSDDSDDEDEDDSNGGAGDDSDGNGGDDNDNDDSDENMIDVDGDASHTERDGLTGELQSHGSSTNDATHGSDVPLSRHTSSSGNGAQTGDHRIKDESDENSNLMELNSYSQNMDENDVTIANALQNFNSSRSGTSSIPRSINESVASHGGVDHGTLFIPDPEGMDTGGDTVAITDDDSNATIKIEWTDNDLNAIKEQTFGGDQRRPAAGELGNPIELD